MVCIVLYLSGCHPFSQRMDLQLFLNLLTAPKGPFFENEETQGENKRNPF